MPTVDVVVPCYRYGTKLPTAVASVLDQSGVDVRVLVIDDASGDGSADVARDLASADPRVEVSVHTENRGHIATFNEGLMDWASADYAVLLSADDALTPGALARATSLLDARPNVGFVYGNAVPWDGSLPLPRTRSGITRPIVYSGDGWLRRRLRLARNCILSPEVVVRTTLQHEVGPYNPKLLHTSDFEMWMRFALRADVGYLWGADQAYYRIHTSNMSSAYTGASGVGDLDMRYQACAEMLRGSGRPDLADTDSAVRRRLAREALVRAGRSYDKGRDDHEELVGFAERLTPDAHSLPEWQTLRFRRWLGPRRAQTLSPLVLTAPARRIRQEFRDLRRERFGV